MATTDLAIHKSLNKARNIHGKSSSINGDAYTLGTTVTLHLPGARAERILKTQNIQSIHRGISKNQWDNDNSLRL